MCPGCSLVQDVIKLSCSVMHSAFLALLRLYASLHPTNHVFCYCLQMLSVQVRSVQLKR